MSTNIKAEIITIGDELLIGQVVDTNSAWIAGELNLLGIDVSQITSVSDDIDHIISALTYASVSSDLIIVTGGLGPTKDDITKAAINSYFETYLIENKSVLKNIKLLTVMKGLTINDLNKRQAEVPEKALVLNNNMGTAPGLLLEKNKTTFVFLPGVPYEMKGIFAKELKPRLEKKFKGPAIVHKTIHLFGIAESDLAILIETWENSLPSIIKLAYLPSSGIIRLRLTAKGEEKGKLTEIIALEIKKLLPVVKDYYFGDDNETLEIVVGNLLKNNNKTVATAESCTGGLIASLLTSKAGSSSFFKGGIVAYSNEIKTSALKVDENLLQSYGAVSEQVVLVMAEEVREFMQVDYAVSVSGIAGPDGGTPAKPVGTVWIGVASKNKVNAYKFNFGEDREKNIRRAAYTALNELRKLIIKDIEKK